MQRIALRKAIELLLGPLVGKSIDFASALIFLRFGAVASALAMAESIFNRVHTRFSIEIPTWKHPLRAYLSPTRVRELVVSFY